MRTAYRMLSTAVAVGAIFPVGTMPAYADTRPVKVEVAAWFWSAQVSGEAAPGVPYPGGVPASASGVPAGDLAVAYKGDTKTNPDNTKTSIPDKETYLSWDIYSVPEGSTVDSFTFTMFVDTAAHNLSAPAVDVPGQGVKGGQPIIVACPPTIGFGDADGDSFYGKPTDNCVDQIFGEYDATKNAYVFDATTFAQDWVDRLDNFGLGIRPTEDAVDPFQLSFLPASKVVASISYTPPAPAPAPVPPVVQPVPLAPVPQVDTGTAYVPGIAQPQPQPAPQPVAPPVVEVRKPVAVQPVAATPLRSTRGLNGAFWFAMIAGVLVLGTMSLILGDPIEPDTGTRTRVRVGGRHRLTVPAGATVRTPRPVRPRTV